MGMRDYELLLKELSEENVRYLPLYYLNEVLEMILTSVENIPKDTALELLYILRMNPGIREKVDELLFLIQ